MKFPRLWYLGQAVLGDNAEMKCGSKSRIIRTHIIGMKV